MKKEKVVITCEDGYRMKVLIYRPDVAGDSPVTGVLWIHGGGYVTGMAAMAGMMGMGPRLVNECGCVVISPEYRTGKRGRYPNALNDCYSALKYMVAHSDGLGIRRDQIFVGGESAGGGLCAALCMLARDRGEVSIAFQMPLYPMIDDRDTDSSRDNHNKVWNTPLNHFGWKTYLGAMYGTDDVPAYAAAARQTDFRNLPPAYTFVCTGEPFYCETVTFVERLRDAGVEAGIDIYEGLYHAFDMLQPRKDVSRIAIKKFLAAFERARKTFFAPDNE
ncbi:MAG: alpha/beta hydrolase [Candidatus Cryptobacteroides sp.]